MNNNNNKDSLGTIQNISLTQFNLGTIRNEKAGIYWLDKHFFSITLFKLIAHSHHLVSIQSSTTHTTSSTTTGPHPSTFHSASTTDGKSSSGRGGKTLTTGGKSSSSGGGGKTSNACTHSLSIIVK
ncbi:hypothetical protein DDB_G0271410 [Dictyostelium discoideum AX4]|uniref:Uncharacterized protein n=1 Tax=Dictyostelium discoideum TaxID=44689 RepID=Q55B84_DICDI|nr:hypothetical protein DDB_G0271410 [Dictyostelium discoideum AX4]EAL71835.1 hypothetical protein DDB_G0271410 [Dictyostelium discoideum AX4]|eukprot:XP_645728.1 hypothetical protein DDB_G0271410 [Dictyostelium discoideum AX4]